MPRSGRRPGPSGSREKILAAARAHFAKSGYDGATIRAIGSSAGVDPALILHFFGSKEKLFVTANELPVDPASIVPKLIAPGIDGLGERMVKFFLETWDRPDGRPFLAMLRSVAGNEKAAEMMREFVAREVLGPVSASLHLDQAKLRASLAASHLLGLALLRYVVRIEPIASADGATLARVVGPTIQHYFDADSPAFRSPRRLTRPKRPLRAGRAQRGSRSDRSHSSASDGAKRRHSS